MKKLTSGHPVLMEKVVDGIIESFNIKPPVNYASVLTMLESWDEAKDRLFIVVYNKDRHAAYLKDNVYTCIECNDGRNYAARKSIADWRLAGKGNGSL